MSAQSCSSDLHQSRLSIKVFSKLRLLRAMFFSSAPVPNMQLCLPCSSRMKRQEEPCSVVSLGIFRSTTCPGIALDDFPCVENSSMTDYICLTRSIGNHFERSDVCAFPGSRIERILISLKRSACIRPEFKYLRQFLYFLLHSSATQVVLKITRDQLACSFVEMRGLPLHVRPRS